MRFQLLFVAAKLYAVFSQPTPGTYLFNHEDDPNELTNLAGLEEYAETQAQLQARLAFYQESADVTPDLQFDGDSNIVWGEVGGVVPWQDDPPEREEEQITEALAGAPNIVFIMLDDVGVNDGMRIDLFPLVSNFCLFVTFSKQNFVAYLS